MYTFMADQIETIQTTGHSSKGNQLKWFDGEYWYKADYMGYEGLSEVLVSKLAKRSNLNLQVEYEPVRIEYKGREYKGCRSRNFLGQREELVPLEKLYRQVTGMSLTSRLASMEETEEKILFATEFVKKVTGLYDFGTYLAEMLTIDTLFLNEDRHTNNIAVIYDLDRKQYRLCPHFDNGLSLFADMTVDFPLNKDLEECYKCIEAKPFNRSFDEQLDAVEALYDPHFKFSFSVKDVLRELSEMEGQYDKQILKRVEKVLREQMRKYQYLF